MKVFSSCFKFIGWNNLSFLIHKKAKGWLECYSDFKVEHGFLDKFQAILKQNKSKLPSMGQIVGYLFEYIWESLIS